MLGRLFRRGDRTPAQAVAVAAAPTLYGIVAEFDSAEALLAAAERANAEGYTQMDGFSPFPIEGLSEAVGFKGTALSRVVFVGGISGATGAFLLQTIGMAVDYPYNIGGRPLVSWPMFIPITFEGTILIAAFSAVIGLIVACGFPAPYHPVFNAPNFERASQDGFFLAIEANDPKFDRSRTRQFVETLGATRVSEVEN